MALPTTPLRGGGNPPLQKGPYGAQKVSPPLPVETPRNRLSTQNGWPGCLDPQATTPSGDRLNRNRRLCGGVEAYASAQASSQIHLASRFDQPPRLFTEAVHVRQTPTCPTHGGRARHRPAPSPVEVHHVR